MGTESPTQQKTKKSHSRRMAIKRAVNDVVSETVFFSKYMANICQISPEVSAEISQNFNTIPLCSYLETFDTTPEIDLSKPIPKKWENKHQCNYNIKTETFK